jgi:hypothetical protein
MLIHAHLSPLGSISGKDFVETGIRHRSVANGLGPAKATIE